MIIIVGTTIGPYKTAPDPRTATEWLTNAADIIRSIDGEVCYFAALEKGRGAPQCYEAVCAGLAPLPHDIWHFSINDGSLAIDSGTRLIRITMGRNLIVEHAMRIGADAILFVDSDIAPPADCLPKLLDLDAPLAGGHVPTYNMFLNGPRADGYPPEWDCRAHWTTAGFLLVRREVFRSIRWGTNADLGQSDDPHYQGQAKALGFGETVCRHDLVAHHWPGSIGDVTGRGHDLALR